MTELDSEFDTDTAVEALGGGRYRGDVSPRWAVFGGAPNGGYVVSLGLRALVEELGRPDAPTVTAQFLAPCEVGPIDVEVEVLRTGRRIGTAVARLIQGGEERVRVTGMLTDLDRASGLTHEDGGPPDLPPLEECVAPPDDAGLPPVIGRFDMRMDPSTVGWVVGRPSGTARIAGWVRFADGRPADSLALPTFADAFPPVAFNVLDELGWVPTLELTVHGRRRPVGGWLRGVFSSRFVVDGYHEEDGELWDDSDRLVAMSRQLALVRT